ncbi:TlpA disulfide reductase family protein [Chitinophaga sp. CF418]|uniref:TlpA disulfide reductase family protein n=1 Tax=Chitinophaga sp. CF418 TaxID=1855287 RepID=UPI00091CEDD8|nr:TlpA disulfide reductase family protein [Chitinophaga sp. CF418]SHN33493.1 Peroxiredoxin [Chitinophaga sp. CF418]
MHIHKILMLAVLGAPLASYAQQSYTIKGSVGKLNAPAKAYLTYKVKGQRIMDSVIIHNGQFTFRGTVGAPKEAHIVVKHDDEPQNPITRPKDDILPFFIEDKVITITAKDSVHKAVIKGSPANDDNAKVTAILKPYYDKYTVLNEEYKSQPEEKKKDSAYLASLDERANSVQKEIIATKMKYVKANLTHYMALVAFNSTIPPEFDAVAAEKNFNELDEKIRKSDLGEELLARILKVKKTQEGAPAPDFTQTDVNGKAVKLSDFKGKYVLLDFWASWCGPCRRENPNVVKAYNAYKDKGFTVLGVSLDKPGDRDKWLAAIEKDGLPWTQVSDLKAWDNEAAKLYEVNAIPMNFLIDPNGKIIAKYLRGEALEATLKKLLQ